MGGGGNVRGKRRIQTNVKLPMLNWVAIDRGNIENTIFSQIDDENIHEIVDFSTFQDAFALGKSKSPSKLDERQDSAGRKTTDAVTLQRARGPISVLDMNRARNLGIATRRIGLDIEGVIDAIEKMDMEKIPAEKAELLRNEFIPTPEETSAIKARIEKNEKIAPLDDMLFKLSQVPRAKAKLSLLMNMENAEEVMKRVSPSAEAVVVASSSLMQSRNLKKLFEVILAYGNLMNSSRRGGVYGFKLSVFDRLISLKSADRSMNLMHYVVQSIMESEQLKDVANFRDDLIDLDTASAVSLVSLKGELGLARNTVLGIKRELEAGSENEKLTELLAMLEPQVQQAEKDLMEATETYNKVLKFYCETNVEPSSFFGIFVRVKKSYTDAEKDVVLKKRHEAAMAEKARQAALQQQKTVRQVLQTDVPEDEEVSQVVAEDDTFDENSETPAGVGVKKAESHITKITTVEDGTIDNIMEHMKKEAFRRPEGQHKKETRRRMSMRGNRQGQEQSSYSNSRPWLK